MTEWSCQACVTLRDVPKQRAKKAHRPAVTPAGLRTRAALLDAGIAVAEKHGLAGLSVNTVVAQAALAKGTFYVHFADRDAFLDALHERFYAQVGEAVAAAVRDRPHGAERLARGIEAYLDACFAERAVKAMLIDLRTQTKSIEERSAFFARLVEPNLAAMGWPDPKGAARLVVAMTSEAVVQEIESGRRRPALRRALLRAIAPERG
jgi:AcrR family transcriptional regulator